MAKDSDQREAILERLSNCDLETLRQLEETLRRRSDIAMDGERAYLDFLEAVALSDVRGLMKAEHSYGNSWKQRGGVGAFMMLARKWDRIEQRVVRPIGEAMPYDVFEHIVADHRAEGVIDDIRDLRRYLLLVEAEMAARDVVQIGDARDNREES